MPPTSRKFYLSADRLTLLLSLSAIAPLGFASKFYQGLGHSWVRNYAGDILYEIFWILLIALVWPQISPLKISLGVFVATALLEFLQLWHPPLLESIRATFLGRTLIGTTYAGWDFLYYGLGCWFGWLWLKLISNRHTTERR